ncbi:MAG: DUF1844 domain-containing protein [Gemmatimonadota bacterium]
MTEAEGRYRERRSAHGSEEEKTGPRPAPPEEPARGPVTPLGGPAEDRDARIAMPGGQTRPEPGEAGGTPFPEGPFFEIVQYVVLRASQSLGEIPFDETGEKRVLPREAKGYIDLLSALHERTKGDLSKEAESALDNVLSDLRMRYLELG